MRSSIWIMLLYAAVPPVNALWPLPKNLELGSTFVELAPDFDISVSPELRSSTPDDLQAAITRTTAYLIGDKHRRLNPGRGEQERSQLRGAPVLSTLALSLTNPESVIQSISVEAVKPLSSRNERYSLTLPSDGSPAIITADSTLGLLRGLTTFEQLWHWVGEGDEGVIYCHETPVVITDDVPTYVRFVPVAFQLIFETKAYTTTSHIAAFISTLRETRDIQRTLDAMSMVKMSMLQWHIVDSQSFPLDVPGYPEISREGAYSLQERYKIEDVLHVVAYAAERGIDVLLEIDTPGHTTSIASSHPEHIACANAEPWYDYAHEPPAGQLRISSAETRKFTASLLKQVAELLPSSMFGTGGDEINMRCYLDDVQTQRELRELGIPLSEKGLNQVLDEFIKETHGALKELNKTPVVWEEIALAHDLKNLANDTIITIWTDSDRAVDAVKKGFRVVHAPSNFFYLDCGGGGWLGDWTTGNSWCDPYKTWQKAYSFDPLDAISPEQAHLVLGGQQLLWTEQSSPENLDSIVWPRAAVSAEIFWTGSLAGRNQTTTGALARLHDLRYRMVRRGIKAVPLQPHWCAIQPEKCSAGSWAKKLATIEGFTDKCWRWIRKWGIQIRGALITFDRIFPEL